MQFMTFFIAHQFSDIAALLADGALHDDHVDRGDDSDLGAVVPDKVENGVDQEEDCCLEVFASKFCAKKYPS